MKQDNTKLIEELKSREELKSKKGYVPVSMAEAAQLYRWKEGDTMSQGSSLVFRRFLDAFGFDVPKGAICMIGMGDIHQAVQDACDAGVVPDEWLEAHRQESGQGINRSSKKVVDHGTWKHGGVSIDIVEV